MACRHPYSEGCPLVHFTRTNRGEDLNDWRRADHPMAYLFILGCVIAAGVVALSAHLGVW